MSEHCGEEELELKILNREKNGNPRNQGGF